MDNDLCKKCGACCRNIKADINAKILYWDGKIELTESFASMLIPNEHADNMYACKYLKNNLCTNEQKPDICKQYPLSPFVNLPDECDYTGEIFMKREKVKQKIRRLKEEIIHYEALISRTKDKKEQNQLRKIINQHKKQIEKFNEYGSQNW